MAIRPWGVAATEDIKLPVHVELVGISIIGKLYKQITQSIYMHKIQIKINHIASQTLNIPF